MPDDLASSMLRCSRHFESAIGPHEELEEKLDRTFWAEDKRGIEWAEEFIDGQFLGKTGTDDIDAQLTTIFEGLEDAMGRKGSKVRVAWPVVLLLATRKECLIRLGDEAHCDTMIGEKLISVSG